jgi:hypothetical protein
MTRHLSRVGWCIGRKRVRRLMSKISLAPIYQAPKTSERHPPRKIYTPAAAHDDRAAAEPGLVPSWRRSMDHVFIEQLGR